MKDYYGILGVEQNASFNEIELAHMTLIEKYHPENFAGEAKKIVEDRIEDIKEAYSVLSDDFLRNQYDKEIGIVSSVKPVSRVKGQSKNSQQSKTNNQNEDYINSRQRKEAATGEENRKKEKSTVGTLKGVVNVADTVFSNMPKIKFKKPDKKSILSLLVAIAIIVILGVILWFIPFTNGFMRSFLLMN